MQYNHLVETRSFYIHWPFCPYKCHFCPFVALASQDQFMGQYHDALKKEILQFAQLNDQKRPLDTIFFGGGTPSTYPDELLLDMFVILKRVCVFDQSSEISIEVNPGTVHTGQLALWKELGINRLSIGVQSLKDSVLKKLNRHQSQEDVYRLLKQASVYFDNLSVDLILGLPGVSEQEWKDLLAAVVSWPINHVSIYFLTVHESTPLYFKVKKEEIVLPCDDYMVDTYYWSLDFLAEHGFEQYELSNFARGKEFISRHNSVYWDRKPYKGFGLGACSFDGRYRLQNEKSLMRYMQAIHEEKDCTIMAEKLTEEQIRLEKIMLGLRRAQGVTVDDLAEGLSVQQEKQLHEQVSVLKDKELLTEQKGKIFLTPQGLAVEHQVAIRLSV